MWIERRADGFDDPPEHLIVHVSQDAAKGAEPSKVANQLPLGERTGYVERPNVDIHPAAFF